MLCNPDDTMDVDTDIDMDDVPSHGRDERVSALRAVAQMHPQPLPKTTASASAVPIAPTVTPDRVQSKSMGSMPNYEQTTCGPSEDVQTHHGILGELYVSLSSQAVQNPLTTSNFYLDV
jgi:hypothetical protein